MKVENFVAELNANEGKWEAICKQHVTKKYMSFMDKIIDCNRIVRATMEYPDKDDPKKMIFRQNTPARYLQLTMLLVERYTDIEIDEDNLLGQYDKLDEAGVLEVLTAALPPHEVNEFNTLLSMTVEDYLANKRSLVSYLDSWTTMPVLDKK